jgi:hypothetical protein
MLRPVTRDIVTRYATGHKFSATDELLSPNRAGVGPDPVIHHGRLSGSSVPGRGADSGGVAAVPLPW